MGNKSRNRSGKKWAQVRNVVAAGLPSARKPPQMRMLPADTVRIPSGSSDKPLRTVEVFSPTSMFHASSALGTYRK